MSYAGTILWVDLKERKIEKELTSEYISFFQGLFEMDGEIGENKN